MSRFNTINPSFFLVIGFMVLLILPNVIMLTDIEEKSEFSKLTKFPEIDRENLKLTFVGLKNYYKTHFGLKHTLVNSYLNFKINLLDEDPIPDRVVKGREDWYFLGNEHNRVLDNAFGIHKYSKSDLYIMKQNLMELNQFINSLNIKLYFVIPPNKSTIYQDKLPYTITQQDTPLTQFLSTINTSDSLNIIDLRKVLLKSKNNKKTLYHKTDTHWNDYGAYIGYQYVLGIVSNHYSELSVVPLEKFNLSDSLHQGDITRMINIYNKELIASYSKPKNSMVLEEKNTYYYKKYLNNSKDSKLLMFRDSFAINWFDYFNESFGETVYLRYHTISKSQIIEEQPDIIILEVAERNLDVFLKTLKLSD